jgi:hypothetical protein
MLSAGDNGFTFTNSELENVKTYTQVVIKYLNKWWKDFCVQTWTGP